MKVVGCVAEFNPFHNGHKYFIDSAKRETGATHFVAVMSEYFTQRGEPAILTSAARAEAAILSGVDLVLSLPVSFALSSAEKFAFGGVSLLDALNCVDCIAYGSESADNSNIIKVCKAVMSDSFTDEFARISRNNAAFAVLREEAVKNILTDIPEKRISEILKSPNDILAVEYNKAIIKLGASMKSIAIKRKNVSHDDAAQLNGFASASYIRNLIFENKDFSEYLPLTSEEIIKREYERTLGNNYGEKVLTVLRRLKKEDFINTDDVNEGLENRIIAKIASAKSLEELYDEIKTKRYAHSRIRRIIIKAFIGIESEVQPAAIKVLGFNKKGAEILSYAKKRAKLPIITKPADYPTNNKEICIMMENEKKAADMYGILCRTPISVGDEYKKIPVKFVKNH